MELELEGVKIKVYESGEVHRLYKKGWVLRTGSKNTNGYIKTKINKKTFAIHRIVYKAFNPDWDMTDSSPDNQIDHINRVRDDNRIINLRVANNSQNQQNQNVKGYHWCNYNKYWRAQIRIHNATRTIHCKTEEEAIQAVHELRTKYYEFYERTEIPDGL